MTEKLFKYDVKPSTRSLEELFSALLGLHAVRHTDAVPLATLYAQSGEWQLLTRDPELCGGKLFFIKFHCKSG